MSISLKVICPWIGTVSALFIYGWFNRFINKQMDERLLKIKKEKGIDILQINVLLYFGISEIICSKHDNVQFDCGNLACNYGKLNSIIKYIENAKHTLDVCIYIILAKIFGEVIIKAHKRGVRVRVITDAEMSFSTQSYINNFREIDIPTRQKRSPYIMHHKFIIVDSEILINGSMNFTVTGAFGNVENVMITSQTELVESFEKEFERLWKNFQPVRHWPPALNVVSMIKKN